MNDIENLRQQIISLSLKQIHKPYKHGSHGPDSFDCAGLVWYIYNEILNIDIYEDGYGISTTGKIMTSKYGKLEIYEDGLKTIKFEEINLGDILFFHRQSKKYNKVTDTNKYPGHVGIYLGEERFIHSTSDFNETNISDFSEEKWIKKLVSKKDIFSK